MFRIVLILLATLSSAPAFAAGGSVYGTVAYCCDGYWSTVTSKFRVHYENAMLPPGTEVNLRHGFTRSEFVQGEPVAREHWTDLVSVPMTAQSATVWELTVERETYWRGSSEIYTAMDFVFEIHLPDGTTQWDKGSATTWGYYEVPTPGQSPGWLGVSSIEKN